MARMTDKAGRAPKWFYDDAVSNTAVAVMTTDGNLYGFYMENENASDVYLQIFNAAQGDVTVGTTAPDYTFRCPAGSSLGKDAQEFPMGFFDTALTIAVTTTRTGGTAAASATAVQVWHSQK